MRSILIIICDWIYPETGKKKLVPVLCSIYSKKNWETLKVKLNSMATMSVYHQNGVAGQAINYTTPQVEFTIVPPQYSTPIYEVSLGIKNYQFVNSSNRINSSCSPES